MNVFTFRTGYRRFSLYWWREIFRPRFWIKPFKAAYQRVTRGWADQDVWSLDAFITCIMLDTLAHLKINCGVPSEVCTDPFHTTDEDVARWKGILDKMIAGFCAAEELLEPPQEFFAGTFDRKGYDAWKKAHEKEMKTGFDLLYKYFHSLWY